MLQKNTLQNTLQRKLENESGKSLRKLISETLAEEIDQPIEQPEKRSDTLYSDLRRGTDSEILGFVERRLGLTIPRKALCPGHNAPAEFFLKALRQEERDFLVLANRNGSKTTLFSALSFLDSINFRDCETYVVAGSLSQAQKCHKYTKKYWDMSPEFSTLLAKEPMLSETILKNGSIIKVLAGSTTAVHGPHGPRLKGDEIEEMDHDVFEGMLSIPETRGEMLSSTILASTRHKPFGIMEQLTSSYREQGYVFYQWCYKEVAARCSYSCKRYNGPASGVYSTCPLWDSCQGILHEAVGFYAVDDIISKFLKLDTDVFISQWECGKPKKHGMVFDSTQMIEDPDLRYIKGARAFILIDWGFSAPACFLLIQMVGERIHILDELYVQWKTDPELCDQCDIFEGKAVITKRLADFEDPKAIEYFNQHGKPTIGVAGKKYKYPAIKERRNYYRQGRVIVNSRKCKRFIKEEKALHYIRDKQTDSFTEEIADSNDHGPTSLNNFFAHLIMQREEASGPSKVLRIHSLSDIREERRARAEAEAQKEA